MADKDNKSKLTYHVWDKDNNEYDIPDEVVQQRGMDNFAKDFEGGYITMFDDKKQKVDVPIEDVGEYRKQGYMWYDTSGNATPINEVGKKPSPSKEKEQSQYPQEVKRGELKKPGIISQALGMFSNVDAGNVGKEQKVGGMIANMLLGDNMQVQQPAQKEASPESKEAAPVTTPTGVVNNEGLMDAKLANYIENWKQRPDKQGTYFENMVADLLADGTANSNEEAVNMVQSALGRYANRSAMDVTNQVVSSLPDDTVQDAEQSIGAQWYSHGVQDKLKQEADSMGISYDDYVAHFLKPAMVQSLVNKYGPNYRNIAEGIATRLYSHDEHVQDRLMKQDIDEALLSVISKYVNPSVVEEYNKAQEEGSKAFNEGMEGSQYIPANLRLGTALGAQYEANEAKDPQKILSRLMVMNYNMLSDPKFRLKLAEAATNVALKYHRYGEYKLDPDRINGLVLATVKNELDQLEIKGMMPKGSAEYIMKTGLGNTIVGKITRKAVQTDYQNWLEDIANQQYQPGFWENVASGALTFAGDAWSYWLPGAAGGKLTKSMVAKAEGNLAGDLMAKGMERKMAERAAKVLIGKSKAAALKSGAVHGAVTFGGQSAISKPIDEVYRTGQFDENGMIYNPSVGKVIANTLGEVAKQSAVGAIMQGGTIANMVGKGRGLATNILADVGGKVVDSGIMTGHQMLERMAQDPNFKPTGKDAAESFLESMANLTAIGLPGMVGKYARFKDAREFNKKFDFTDQDIAELKRFGYDGLRDAFEKVGIGEYAVVGENAQRLDGQLTQKYMDLMNDKSVPEVLKAKMMAVVEGKRPSSFSPVVDSIIVQPMDNDGKVYLETLNKDGGIVERKEFSSLDEAQKADKKLEYEKTLGLASVLEGEFHKEFTQEHLEGLYNKAAQKYNMGEKLTDEDKAAVYLHQNAGAIKEIMDKQQKGIILTDEEQKQINAYRHYYDSALENSSVMREFVNTFEDSHGVERGTLRKALESKDKKYAPLVESYLKELYNSIELKREMKQTMDDLYNTSHGNEQKRIEQGGVEGEKPTAPVEGSAGGQEPPVSEGPSPYQGNTDVSSGQGEGVSTANSDNSSADVITSDAFVMGQNAYKNEDSEALQAIGYNSDLATGRLKRAFADNEKMPDIVANAYNEGRDMEQFVAQRASSLTPAQKEAISKYVEAMDAKKGAIDALQHADDGYGEALKQQLWPYQTVDGNIVPATLDSGKQVFLKKDNEYGGAFVVVPDEQGLPTIKQVSKASIIEKGTPVPLDEYIEKAVAQQKDARNKQFISQFDGTSLKPNDTVSLSINDKDQPTEAKIVSVNPDGTISFNIAGSKNVTTVPVDTFNKFQKYALRNSINAELDAEDVERAEKEAIKAEAEKKQRYANGIVGLSEGQPDYSSKDTDAKVAAEYLQEQFGEDHGKLLNLVNGSRDDIKTQLDNKKKAAAEYRDWLDVNADLDPEKTQKVENDLALVNEQIADLDARFKNWNAIRNSVMTPDELRTMKEERKAEIERAGIDKSSVLPDVDTGVRIPENSELKNKYPTQEAASGYITSERRRVYKMQEETQREIDGVDKILNQYMDGDMELSAEQLRDLNTTKAELANRQNALTADAKALKGKAESLNILYIKERAEQNKKNLEALSPKDRRKELVAKALEKKDIKAIKEIYKDASTDVMDLTPRTLEEFVSERLFPHSLNAESLAQELGSSNFRRGIGSKYDTNKFNYLLANNGEGLTISELAKRVWEDLSGTMESGAGDGLQSTYTDQDIRNTILDMFKTYDSVLDMRNVTLLNRIAAAENELSGEEEWYEQQKEREIFEKQKEIDEYKSYIHDKELSLPSESELDYINGLEFDRMMEIEDREREYKQYVKSILPELADYDDRSNEEGYGGGSSLGSDSSRRGVDEGNSQGEEVGNGEASSESEIREGSDSGRKGRQETGSMEPGEGSAVRGSHLPQEASFGERLKSAIAETETEPTEAQKKAGNYKKGHLSFGGYDYTVETPKGVTRSGKDEQGKPWSVTMHDTYGYILGKIGVDGDHIDMFINDAADLDTFDGNVYVVDQVNPETGEFDEHKVMYGYPSEEAATEAYLANYSKGWKGLGKVTSVPKATFDKWLESSDRKTKPFREYAMIQHEEAKKAKEEGEMLGFPAIDKEGEPINNHIIELVKWAKEQGLEIDPTSKLNSYADLFVMCKDDFGICTLVPDEGEDINQVVYFPDSAQVIDQLGKLQEEFNAGRDLKHSSNIDSELTEGVTFYDADTAREFKDFVNKKLEKQNKFHNKLNSKTILPFHRDVKEVKPSEMTEAQKVAYDAVSTMLKKAGIPVKVVSNEDMEKVAEAQDNSLFAKYKDWDRQLKAVAEPGVKFLRTYHGSGASFDKFDLSHALEGEGSETFGHGVYVTSSREIGREYAQRAKQKKMANLYKTIRYPDGVKGDTFKRRLFGEMVNDVATGGDVKSAKEFAKKRVGADANDVERTLEHLKDREKGTEYEQNLKDGLAKYKDALKWIDSLDDDYLTQGNATRYEVEIPEDNGSNYIDWKNKLKKSHLSKVNKELVRIGKEPIETIYPSRVDGKVRGQDLYDELSAILGSKEAASKLLSDAGFVGIKYPAGTIYGGAKEGDYNYVIFDENNAQIVDHTKFAQGKGVVYGYTDGKEIVLNQEHLNPNTPIHEYQHLWRTAAKNMNPELIEHGDKLVMQTQLFADLKQDPNYNHLTDEQICDEAFARLTGEDGAAILEQMAKDAIKENPLDTAKELSVINKLKEWLKKFWYWTLDTFTKWKPEDIKKMTLEDIRNLVLRDLANGVDPRNVKSRMTKEDAVSLRKQMADNAEQERILEHTEENWLKEFGKDSRVTTPIGSIKLGENQYKKAGRNDRIKRFGLLKPTLERPDVILEKSAPKEGAERQTKYLFIKSFKKADGNKILNYESITVKQGEEEVAISAHQIDPSKVLKELTESKVLWNRFRGDSNSLGENQGSALTPSANNPSGKDSVLNPHSDANIRNNIETTKGNGGNLSVEDKIKAVSQQFGVDEADVAMYANAVKKGSTAEAARARANIKRHLLQANEDKISSLKELLKYTVPVNNALKENFGDLDAMIEERVKQVEAQRNAMEAARKRAAEEEAKRQKHLEELSVIPDDQLDKQYMDALAKGDDATAREMLDEAARRKGYDDTESSYQGVGAWKAPGNPGYESDKARRDDWESSGSDVNLEDMALGYTPQPDDYFSHPERYSQNTPHGLESVKAINAAIDAIKNGEKDVKVKVYRAVPTSVKEGKLRNGDWVTPSKKYADIHGNNRLEGKYRIIEDEVPATQLWWDGNDANEFGFDDGKEYKYKNAKNSRKLNDLVTYDNKGDVIPPSKRFNSRKSDVRFMFAGEKANVKPRLGSATIGLKAAKDKVVELFHKAKSGEFNGKPQSIGTLTQEGKKFLEDLSGLKMKDKIDFVLNPSDLKHMNKDHFGDNEKDPGRNIPLTEEDLRSMVDVIMNPEQVVYGIEKMDNRKAFFFLKQAEDGTLNLAEIYSDKKGNLTAKSYYKTKKGVDQRVMEIKNSLLPTPEASSGSPLSDGKGINFFSIEQEKTAENERKIADSVVNTANKLGGAEATVYFSLDDVPEEYRSEVEQGAKGWYDPETHSVHVYLPNCEDGNDAQRTVFHEKIGHEGMEVLLGGEDGVRKFANFVYRSVGKDVRGKIIDFANKYDPDWKNPDRMNVGTQEYIAHLAEEGPKTAEDFSLWTKIKHYLIKVLKKLGVRVPGLLNDKDLRYYLMKAGKALHVWDNMPKENQEAMMKQASNAEIKDALSDGANLPSEEDNKPKKKTERGRIDEATGAFKLAPNGEQSNLSKKQYIEARTKNFKDWFGGDWEKKPKDFKNKLDANGEPLEKYVEGYLNRPKKPTMPKKRKGEDEATFFGRKMLYSQALEDWPKTEADWKKRIDEFDENTLAALTPPDEEAIREKYQKQYENDMASWRKDHPKIKEGEERPLKIPDMRDYQSIQDYGEALGKHEIWKTAPNKDEYERMAEDEIISKVALMDAVQHPFSEYARLKTMKAEFQHMRHVMQNQKVYDQNTTDAVVQFAKRFMSLGYGDDLGRGSINTLLTIVKNSTGKKSYEISQHLYQVMDVLMNNQLRNFDRAVMKTMSIKELKENAKGIQVQGKLELRGQTTIKAFRDAVSSRISSDKLDEKISNLIDKMATDKKNASSYQDELLGLNLAKQYVDYIDSSRNDAIEIEDMERMEIEGYKNRKGIYEGELTKALLQEHVERLNQYDDALFNNKVERMERYSQLLANLGGMIDESVKGARVFQERDARRAIKVKMMASADLGGKSMNQHHKENWKTRLSNSDVVRLFCSPLGSFDALMREFGSKQINGEGQLWNHFVRGAMKASNDAFKSVREANNEIDLKVSELFGKVTEDKNGNKKGNMILNDLYALERSNKVKSLDVTIRDIEGEQTYKLQQGNLMYIYMVNKMPDGAMKLRQMGILDADVERIKENIDPRFLKLADWIQGEFLPKMRTKYNKRHEELFGAPMPIVENYFPLRVLKNARYMEEDVNNTSDGSNALPSTATGAIIKRKTNKLPLDILNADALSVTIDNIKEMENWYNYAPIRKDANTLLSDTAFRNRVQNMTTIYGSGERLWNNVKDATAVAMGTYRPKGGTDLAVSLKNFGKGITGAKISGRLYTAFKQVLSAPMFLPDVDLGRFVRHSVHPYGSFKWAIENLPNFDKRWSGRKLGDTVLMDDPTDWKLWHTNLMEKAAYYGMTPNALVDAVTCAVGARAVYDTKYKQYIKYGLTEERAKEKALSDAEINFNTSQQSSEGAFVSPMQLDRTLESAIFTPFRNSSMLYERKGINALRNLKHRFEKGHKEASIKFMAGQLMEEGVGYEQATKAAEKMYQKGLMQNIADAIVSLWLGAIIWNLGGNLGYLMFGDDNEKKKKMVLDAVILGLLEGPVDGLAGGQFINTAIANTITSDGINLKGLKNVDLSGMPMLSDFNSMIEKFGYDKVAGAQDLMFIVMQSATGFNPKTLTDAINACIDYGNGDMTNAKEIALFVFRLMNGPAATVDNLYIDELGMKGKDAKKLSYEELAKRYAEYKFGKNTFGLGKLYSDEEKQKKLKAIEKSFDKKVSERLAGMDREDLKNEFSESRSQKEKKLIGKIIADELETKDSEAVKKAKADASYLRQRNFSDLMDDLYLQKEWETTNAANAGLEELKSNGASEEEIEAYKTKHKADFDKRKAIQKARKEMQKKKADISSDNDEATMAAIRKLRDSILKTVRQKKK